MSHEFPSDLEIARSTSTLPIVDVAARIGIESDSLMPCGHDKAKIDCPFLSGPDPRANGKLVLVTAISPPAGAGS